MPPNLTHSNDSLQLSAIEYPMAFLTFNAPNENHTRLLQRNNTKKTNDSHHAKKRSGRHISSYRNQENSIHSLQHTLRINEKKPHEQAKTHQHRPVLLMSQLLSSSVSAHHLRGEEQRRTTSFYEDYLHRGEVEPLASMSFYTYGMHVSCVHIAKTAGNVFGEYDFAPHYNKRKEYVQVLHPVPRIPYLHGVTCPSKAKDAEIWSAAHLALFCKHHCSDAKKCSHTEAVRHIPKASGATGTS